MTELWSAAEAHTYSQMNDLIHMDDNIKDNLQPIIYSACKRGQKKITHIIKGDAAYIARTITILKNLGYVCKELDKSSNEDVFQWVSLEISWESAIDF